MPENESMPRWTPGDVIYSTDLNALSEAIERGSRFAPGVGTSTSSFSGSPIIQPEMIFVKVTDYSLSFNYHAFRQYNYTDQGLFTLRDGGANSYNADESDKYAMPLYEINGRAIPVDSYVWAIRSESDDFYVCSYNPLNVSEVDGTPLYKSIHTIEFDQSDGFIVTNPSSGVARIDLTPSGTFTSNVTISNTAPQILLQDTTISEGDLLIVVNNNYAEFREASAPSGSLFVFDLVNYYVGLGVAVPTSKLDVRTGTITSNVSILNLTSTWNNAAVTFNSFTLNITNTASTVSSTLFDWQVGGTSRFKLFQRGDLVVSNVWNDAGTTFTSFLVNTTNTNSATGSLLFDYQLDSVSKFKCGKRGDLTVAQGTITTDLPFFQASTTWDNVATTFTGLNVNITDTNSTSTSLIYDFKVNATSIFKGGKSGDTYISLYNSDTNVVTTGLYLRHNTTGTPASNFGYQILVQLETTTTENRDAGGFWWYWVTATDATRKSTSTWFIYNGGVQVPLLTLQVTVGGNYWLLWGYGDGGTPVDLFVVGPRASGTDIPGSNTYFDGSTGTGDEPGGHFIFRTAPAGTTGSTPGTLAERMRIPSDGGIRFPEAAAPDTPPSGNVALYAKSDGHFYQKDDAGVETDLTSSGGGSFSGANAYNDADQSIDNITLTELTFNQERYDVGDYHSTSSNTGRLTITDEGYYHVGVNIAWAGSSTGGNNRTLQLFRNGSTIIASENAEPLSGGVTAQSQSISRDYFFSASDYVVAKVYQDSGGSVNIKSSGNYSPEFWIHKIG